MSRSNSDYQFVNDDIDQILADLITQYELITGRTVTPSSPERLFMSWVASALSEAYASINYAANQNIPSRAEGENLDALGELFFSQSRPEATAASVLMRFFISEAQASAILIPAGTRVSPINGSPVFQTTEDIYIAIGNTYADVRCECQETGVVGNGYTAGQINTLIDVDNVLYYDHCSNQDESDGGADEASDDQYYSLMVASQDGYSTAGSKGAYEYWAKSVSTDITDVVVNSPSAGCVDIYALMSDGNIASSEIKTLIAAACNDASVRPLTDLVSVEDPETVSYNITLTYYLSKDSAKSASELEAAIEAAVGEYVKWQCARLGRDINPSKLISMVMDAGAKRVVLTSPSYSQLDDGRTSAVAPEIATIGDISLTNGGYEDD